MLWASSTQNNAQTCEVRFACSLGVCAKPCNHCLVSDNLVNHSVVLIGAFVPNEVLIWWLRETFRSSTFSLIPRLFTVNTESHHHHHHYHHHQRSWGGGWRYQWRLVDTWSGSLVSLIRQCAVWVWSGLWILQYKDFVLISWESFLTE